jgi:hypothetical protein
MMEYNTQRPYLIIPEYGRHIQKMVDHAASIKDREERNKTAKAIISVMGQLNPHLRDVPDFKHKLWDHLFIISDFQLDVDSPYDKPTPESIHLNPERISYPNRDFKFKHYGKIIQKMIAKAIAFEEGEEKQVLTKIIANHMKKAFLTWNRDAVDDEKILKDLEIISEGKLKLGEEIKLIDTQEVLAANNKRRKPAKFSKSNNHHRSNKYSKRRNPGR